MKKLNKRGKLSFTIIASIFFFVVFNGLANSAQEHLMLIAASLVSGIAILKMLTKKDNFALIGSAFLFLVLFAVCFVGSYEPIKATLSGSIRIGLFYAFILLNGAYLVTLTYSWPKKLLGKKFDKIEKTFFG